MMRFNGGVQKRAFGMAGHQSGVFLGWHILVVIFTAFGEFDGEGFGRRAVAD